MSSSPSLGTAQHDVPASLTASVVVCTYNGARFLPRQLDSLLAQQRLPEEIVLRDDRSTDGTWQLLERFAAAATARGIRVDLDCNRSNLGYRQNFESALAAARGQVLFLCDQDDVWHPEKLSLFMQAFAQDPGLAGLHCDARLVDAEGHDLGATLFGALGVSAQELARMHRGQNFDVLLRRNIVTGAAFAFRAELLPLARPFPVSDWSHDEWVAIILSLSHRLDSLALPLIDYRQHEANQLGARKPGLKQKVFGTGQNEGYVAATVRRLQQLIAFVQSRNLEVTDEQRQALSDRLEHARFRSALPPRLRERWRGIRQELRLGRYQRYGAGLRSLVRDLFNLA